MNRRVVVEYVVQDRVVTDIFTAQYDEIGDISMSWADGVLNVKMMKAVDRSGNQVAWKIYTTAITAEVSKASQK